MVYEDPITHWCHHVKVSSFSSLVCSGTFCTVHTGRGKASDREVVPEELRSHAQPKRREVAPQKRMPFWWPLWFLIWMGRGICVIFMNILIGKGDMCFVLFLVNILIGIWYPIGHHWPIRTHSILPSLVAPQQSVHPLWFDHLSREGKLVAILLLAEVTTESFDQSKGDSNVQCFRIEQVQT